MKTLRDANIKNKTILLRVDFNVIIEDGKVTEDFRMRAALPTIRHLLENGADRVVAISHFGRPEGARNKKYSLAPVAGRLAQMLNEEVEFVDDCIGERVGARVRQSEKRVIVLENLRFYSEEEENDKKFAEDLASLGEIFVQDAFGVCHREHASTVGIPKFLPAYAGLLVEKEVGALSPIVENPTRPLAILIGGAKISTKMGVIEKFLDFADSVCLGGALASTVLKAKGMAVGRSLVEEGMVEKIKDIQFTDTHLHLPLDVKVAKDKDATNGIQIRGVGNVEDDEIILDIGPDTQALFADVIGKAKTVVWNGPMGYIENEQFLEGSQHIARSLVDVGQDTLTVVGGGDTYLMLENLGIMDKIDFVSSGGGAMLDFLSKGTLPGIEALGE